MSIGSLQAWSIRLVLAACAIVHLAGCSTPASYSEPITKFQKASAVVIEGARIEYAGVNKLEREGLIDRYAAAKEKITIKNISGPEALGITPSDLRARMVALRTLEKHGTLLLSLASSDAGKRSNDAAVALGDSVGALKEALTKTKNDEFKTKATAFGTIVGVFAQAAVEAKITTALNQSIANTDAPVRALIRQLRLDMGEFLERRRQILFDRSVLAIATYERERARASPNVDRLEQAVQRVKTTTDDYEKSQLSEGMNDALDAMAGAHSKLVEYARSAKSSQDFSDLIDAIDLFVSRAVIVADAIKAIDTSSKE